MILLYTAIIYLYIITLLCSVRHWQVIYTSDKKKNKELPYPLGSAYKYLSQVSQEKRKIEKQIHDDMVTTT